MRHLACMAEASCVMVVFSASHLAECVKSFQKSNACIGTDKLAAWTCVMA